MVLIPRRWYPRADARSIMRARWPTSPVHRGEHDIGVKTIARGMPVVSAEPVVTAAYVFCCRRAKFFKDIGAASIRHSPRPLAFRQGIAVAELGRDPPRERAVMCSLLFET